MRPLFKDFFRELRHTMGRFLAIFGIVALGVGFFAGLKATSPDMKAMGRSYFGDNYLYDIELLSTMGFSDEDIDALKGVSGVDRLMPAYSTDIIVDKDDSETILHMMGMPDKEDGVNQPILIEGRLPEKSGECVVDSRQMLALQLKVGDTFTLSDKNSASAFDSLKRDTFTVVGTVQSPLYVAFGRGSTSVGNGSIGYFVLIPEEDFNLPVYTEVFLTLSDADKYDCFSTEYDDFVSKKAEELTSLGEGRSEARYHELTDDARKELEDGRAEYEKNKAEFDQKIAAAQKTLDENDKKLTDGEKQLADGKATLSAKEQELTEGLAAYESGKTAADQNRTLLASTKKQLDDLNASITSGRADYRDGLATADTLEAEGRLTEAAALRVQLAVIDSQLTGLETNYNAGIAAYNTGKAQLDAADQTLASSKMQLDEGAKALNAGKAELAEQERTLAEGRKALEASRTELAAQREDGQKQLDDAKQKLDDAQKQLDDVTKPEWYVLDRNMNMGFAGFKQDSDRIDRIAIVFPVFFFLVAALVCLTTMTRMVEEQRVQIGTLKALGYSKFAISMKYLSYAALAGVLGSAAGLAVGFYLFPTVIWYAYSMLYSMQPVPIEFNVLYAAISTGGALVCTLLSTLAACFAELHASPASLMRPKAPKAGKRVLIERISILWKHLSFSKKVTLRNLFRYKKRFFMTILGISGCTALMLTGFGIKDSIGDIVTKQYDEIIRYSMIASLKTTVQSRADFDGTILEDSRISDTMLVQEKKFDVYSATGTQNVTVVVPENAGTLTEFINLRTRIGHNEVAPPDSDTVVISEKLAQLLQVSIGDEIKVKRDDGAQVPVKISGITENYVYHYLYMSPELYTELFREAPEYSSIYLKLPDNSKAVQESLSETLLTDKAISGVVMTASAGDNFKDMLSSLDLVILVLIVCSALLSYVVLYNLTNINITERIREIATIKVLGFYDRETAAYVYRENILLTLIGTAVGLIIGVFLHGFVIETAEIDIVMFGRQIAFPSFVYATLLTMVFALFVNLVMYRKLKKVSMVESLKSIE